MNSSAGMLHPKPDGLLKPLQRAAASNITYVTHLSQVIPLTLLL